MVTFFAQLVLLPHAVRKGGVFFFGHFCENIVACRWGTGRDAFPDTGETVIPPPDDILAEIDRGFPTSHTRPEGPDTLSSPAL